MQNNISVILNGVACDSFVFGPFFCAIFRLTSLELVEDRRPTSMQRFLSNKFGKMEFLKFSQSFRHVRILPVMLQLESSR